MVNPVAGADAEYRVLTAQKMADAALGNHDALGFAGRTRGVDDVSGMVRRGPAASHRNSVVGGQQRLGRPRLQPRFSQHRPQRFTANHTDGTGILHADLQTLHRRVLIHRQPGRASLGDAGLHDQKLDATRQPEADDLSRSNTRFNQRRRHLIGLLVQLAITDPAFAEDQCHLCRIAVCAGFQQISQHLFT